MTLDKKNIASISGRFTHGTASKIIINSVIPSNRAEKEVFWTKMLLEGFSDRYPYSVIKSNIDDSNGNHDVIINLRDNSSIGVQVTEFTYELERTRKHIRDTYLKSIIKEIQKKNLNTTKKTLFSITFPYSDSKKPSSEKPHKVINAIEYLVKNSIDNRLHDFDFGNILCQEIIEGDFYVPHLNNIGIDVNFDNLPRSLDLYLDCVDAIILKKSNSISDWLLIWSVDFWKDKHWLGNEVIDYMRKQISKSNFKKVFFIESIDGDGIFQENLRFYEIK